LVTANLLTGAKYSKLNIATTQNNLNNHARKLLLHAQTKANEAKA